jgi:hypothetical protein
MSKYLAEDGPKSKHLVIQLNEFDDNRFLDMRYFYFDKNDQEYKPTRKGISLTKSNYLMMKKVVEKNHEEVMDWLGVGYVPEHVTEYQKQQEEQAKLVRYMTVGKLELFFENEKRDPGFFRVETLGGQSQLYINEAHVFGNKLASTIKNNNSDNSIIHLILNLLLMYDKSKDGLKGTVSIDPEVLFEQLEYDWANFLKAEYKK